MQFSVVAGSGSTATLYVDDVSLRDNGDAYVAPGAYVRMYSAELVGVEKDEYDLDSVGFVEGHSFFLNDPGAHSVVYRALDYLGHQETDVHTQIIVDTEGPTGSLLINGGQTYTTATNVTLTLSAYDPAGVAQMRIQSDSGVWGAWQPYQSPLPYTFTSPGDGVKTVSVQYEDELGNVGDIYSDDIEYHEPVVMNIPDAKMVPSSTGVRLVNKAVTALLPEGILLPGFFYIEEDDLCAGIRVMSSEMPVSTNVYVTIEGVVQTVEGEREIVLTRLERGEPRSPIPALGINNLRLGGGDFYYQQGITGAYGLNNIGLLVTIWGTVVECDPGEEWFRVDDGSGVNVKCIVPDDVTLPRDGTYVSVTGISSCETIGEYLYRLLRVRTQQDIKQL